MKNSDFSGFWFCVATFTVVLGMWLAWNWYKASVQSDVYIRQGVRMTTWEIFMGAKPIERTINVK